MYSNFSKIPTLKKAEFNSTVSSDLISTSSVWNIRDDIKKTSNDVEKVYIYNTVQDVVTTVHERIFTVNKTTNSTIIWEIIDDNTKYVCEEYTPSEKNPKLAKTSPAEGTFISIYRNSELIKSIQILDPNSSEEPFKKVIPFKQDPSCPFCSVQVSRDKTKLLFTVESNSSTLPFQHVENYGEILYEIQNPTFAIFDLVEGKVIKVLSIEDKVFGQAIWTPDSNGLILVGHCLTPIKLGLTYCSQRNSSLIFYETKSDTMEVLSEEQHSVRDPRFSPNGKFLVWLDMFLGGPHFQCQRLRCINWEQREKSKTTFTLIPIIDYPLENGFPGIYNPMGLPFSCWTQDSRHVIFSTKWSFSHVPVVVDVESCMQEEVENMEKMKKSILRSPLTLPAAFGTELYDWKSDQLLSQDISIIEVRGSFVLAKLSSLLQPHSIGILRLPENNHLDQDSLKNIKWKIIKFSALNANEIHGVESIRYMTHASLKMNLNDLNVFDYETTLIKVSKKTMFNSDVVCSKGQKGLIMVIHGGPHSASLHSWRAALAAFLLDGYSLLMPNYRGSIGYGDASVRSLPGHIGTSDVSDCLDSLTKCLENYVTEKVPVYLFGGSHGGFLTCHLAGRYGKKFQGAIALNPVTELLGMAYSSDIPDWAFVESNTVQYAQEIDNDYTKDQKEKELIHLTNGLQPRGQSWFQGQIVNKGKQFEILAKMSPLSNVNSDWSVPIYVFLGDSDLRVPNWQGRVFYQKVKASTISKDIPCKLFMYPNQGHGLDGVVESHDIYINCIDLFEKTQLLTQ